MKKDLTDLFKSNEITDILFSSEDNEIINSARECGIKVLYRRPKYLAKDNTPTWETILHGLDWYEKKRGE